MVVMSVALIPGYSRTVKDLPELKAGESFPVVVVRIQKAIFPLLLKNCRLVKSEQQQSLVYKGELPSGISSHCFSLSKKNNKVCLSLGGGTKVIRYEYLAREKK